MHQLFGSHRWHPGPTLAPWPLAPWPPIGGGQRGEPAAAAAAPLPADTGVGLTRPQRQLLEAELIRRGIGDALERRVFLAALDYQIAALLERLRQVAPTAVPALVAAACAAAVHDLPGPANGHRGGPNGGHHGGAAEALCQAFVGELALAYDACFETAPTADAGGPFCGILDGLRRVTGLRLPNDHARIDQAIAVAGMC
ncbi:MAG: hypothetical protein EA400_03685 [Chromatiaceae bacterium]|nr:MAG: hypothetical protein EA400_03685 [Chromatiaceae bacterium]